MCVCVVLNGCRCALGGRKHKATRKPFHIKTIYFLQKMNSKVSVRVSAGGWFFVRKSSKILEFALFIRPHTWQIIEILSKSNINSTSKMLHNLLIFPPGKLIPMIIIKWGINNLNIICCELISRRYLCGVPGILVLKTPYLFWLSESNKVKPFSRRKCR